MTLYIKRSLFLLVLFFSGAFSLTAQEKRFSIEAGTENRTEHFRWSIAGNMQGANPNVLSELKFKPIYSTGFYLKGGYLFAKRFSAEISYNRLFTYKGEVTDFDYKGDNRTDTTTELYLQSDKGFMRTLHFGVSFYPVKKENLELLTGIGYNSTKELFYLTDTNDGALNSTYKTTWNGLHFKIRSAYKPVSKLELGGQVSIWPDYELINNTFNVDLNSLDYKAKANWNLKEDWQHPVSFAQNAKGHGFDCMAFISVIPRNAFVKLSLQGLYSNWKTGYGTDKLYQTDGQILKARMNGAFRKSIGLRLTTTFSF